MSGRIRGEEKRRALDKDIMTTSERRKLRTHRGIDRGLDKLFRAGKRGPLVYNPFSGFRVFKRV